MTDLSRILAGAEFRHGERITRKPRTKTGPKPVPELDPHVERSFDTGQSVAVDVAAADVDTVVRKVKASARYITHKRGTLVKVTVAAMVYGETATVRFLARPPIDTGARVHGNAGRWEHARLMKEGRDCRESE